MLELMDRWVKSQVGSGMKKKAVVVFRKVVDCIADLRELGIINMNR